MDIQGRLDRLNILDEDRIIEEILWNNPDITDDELLKKNEEIYGE